MKIKKEKKPLKESIIVEDEQPQDQPLDMDSASKEEIKQDIEQGAAEEGKEVESADAAAEAQKVAELRKRIDNAWGTGKLSTMRKALLRSLEGTLDNAEAGINQKGAFQNIIIYGLAGFGKTSIVRQFCKEFELNLFECDAKSLDIATVGGIPYPKADSAGVMKQEPIMSRYWDELDKPNTVLFLDELNRANGRVRGSLLTLINEHRLPASIDMGNGKVRNYLDYPNILFTVIAINPADDIFQDNEDLDPAMISRNAAVIEQGPDIREFLGHLTSIYNAISKNQYLRPELQAKYAGQFAIAQALLTDKSWKFDNADDVRAIFNQRGKLGNYLNYRSFLSTLLRSRGKKADYIDIIANESGFSNANVLMIKNILATYTDKVTTGNSVFNKNTNPQRAAMAASQVEDALGEYIDSLSADEH